MTPITLDVPEHLLPLLDTIGDELPLVLEMGTIGFPTPTHFTTRSWSL